MPHCPAITKSSNEDEFVQLGSHRICFYSHLAIPRLLATKHALSSIRYSLTQDSLSSVVCATVFILCACHVLYQDSRRISWLSTTCLLPQLCLLLYRNPYCLCSKVHGCQFHFTKGVCWASCLTAADAGHLRQPLQQTPIPLQSRPPSYPRAILIEAMTSTYRINRKKEVRFNRRRTSSQWLASDHLRFGLAGKNGRHWLRS